jgi:hypothetical protein
MKIKNTDIAKELCLPPVKLHCSSKFLFFESSNHFDIIFILLVLAEDAIKAAINDYKIKRKSASN